MENESSKNRFGRFWWLWILCVILSTQIGLSALTQLGYGLVGWGANALISLSLLIVGIFLYNKSFEKDNKNNISIRPFRNILLPWPKAAVLLAIFILAEFVIWLPLFAYTFYPCSTLDAIRKINGCVEHISHRSLVDSIAFSNDGNIFATSEFRGDVKIWSYPDLTLLNNLGNGWPAGAELSISPNGEMIAVCGYKGATSILETRTGRTIYTLLPKNDHGCDIVFATEKNFVFVISDTELQRWDMATGNLSQSIVQDRLEYLEITNDGNYLATGSLDGSINIRYASDGTIFTTIQQPYLQSLAFSYDGKYLITAGVDIESIKDTSKADISIINVWNIETGEVERTITLQGFRIEHISSSQSSTLFAAGGEHCSGQNRASFDGACFYFWQSMDDKMPISLNVPNGIQSLIFSPVDEKILLGSYENLYIWKVP